ncbi:MAG: SUMF1/EgtB/PvdO family nonheme iron enzyme [Gammaproteobacteria bacterium]|nr:SUMF1/EgtB/PvdO family nonheme iron enzyme [Gammaproteobacteria bacterium]
MAIKLELFGNQIDGARDYQEDAFMTTRLGEGEESNATVLVIMADGMGGHAAGNVASNMVTTTFNRTFAGLYPADDVPGALKQALLKANDSIRQSVRETPGLKGMGCTMVSVFVQGTKLWWVSVGDSHLYLLRERSLNKLNADHSYGGYLQRMREQGMAIEPDTNLSPNMLMSAMIGDEIAEIDLSSESLDLQPGDRLLICSDGLDTLGQGSVIQYSSWAENPRDCVNALLEAVESAGQAKQDNTTVVCVDVVEEADVPAKKAETVAKGRLLPEGVPEPANVPELEPDPELTLVPAPGGPPPPREVASAPEEEEDESGRRRGLVVGIVLVLLLAVAGGAGWYFFQGQEQQPAPTVAEAPTVDEPITEPAPPEMVPEPEVAVDEEEPEPPPAEEAGPVPGDVFRDALEVGGQGPEMVVIPRGSFTMGGRLPLKPEEQPRYEVTVPAFAVSRYEVTFAEYDRFARATGRRLPPDDGLDRETRPVTGVSWDDAYAYTNWLSKQTGERYRLPSEAEWEYMARAGSSREYWWGRDIGRENAHCFDCESGLHPRQPAKVGFFEASPFGVYDTAGNVAEWVRDCWHPDYRGAPTDGSVWEGGDCTQRVVRGGSYSNASSALRSAARDKLPGNKGYDNVGIRLARGL